MTQGNSGMPSTSATTAGTRDSSSWRGGTWTRTSASANAHSTAMSSVDLKTDGFFKALTGHGKEKEKAAAITSGLNLTSPTSPSSSASPRMPNVFSLVERSTFRPSPTESSSPTPPPFLPPKYNIGRAEGAVASVGVGSGSGSVERTVSTVAHDRVERRLTRDRERQRLVSAAAAALVGVRPVAHTSATRDNGTTTASEFARPRGASGHGHARVASLHGANTNTIALANHVTLFFGPGNAAVLQRLP
ncbi:hypothetical protein DFH11DRAFT_1733783 [Phellopilus nigrolimitatus]|nr:hypothetical protein DFH11DRAFT_1733783 [Phellopilus nigrolimitatus]